VAWLPSILLISVSWVRAGCNSVVECLPSTGKTLGYIPSCKTTTKIQKFNVILQTTFDAIIKINGYCGNCPIWNGVTSAKLLPSGFGGSYKGVTHKRLCRAIAQRPELYCRAPLHVYPCLDWHHPAVSPWAHLNLWPRVSVSKNLCTPPLLFKASSWIGTAHRDAKFSLQCCSRQMYFSLENLSAGYLGWHYALNYKDFYTT
jgi:hypothetical protein